MNAHIRQLYYQCQDESQSTESCYQKFAELIIHECLTLVDKVRDECDTDDESQQALGAAWAGMAIAQHFHQSILMKKSEQTLHAKLSEPTIDGWPLYSGLPQLEPVAWKMKGVPAFATSRPNDTDSIKWDALYTAPPQREWQTLDDDDIYTVCINLQHMCYNNPTTDRRFILARAIEAKLKEKNT
jgi:hypothetical protein